MELFDRGAAERAALEEADELAARCDAWLVTLANTLLGTLAGFATLRQDWRRALDATVGPEAGAAAARQVEAARTRFHLGEPIGTVQHGARIFGDDVLDQQAERRLVALRLLAATGRLVQASGRGGHSLVILSAEHLNARRLGLSDRPAGLAP